MITTSKERTVIVPQEIRTVYVERTTTAFDRTVFVTED